jgi:hypothetical protein
MNTAPIHLDTNATTPVDSAQAGIHAAAFRRPLTA